MAVCLALNGASRRAGVWLLQDGLIIAGESVEAQRGQAQWLACAVERVLRTAPPPELIAVTVGPGSFTGIRAALALAHGLALGSARPVVGVTVGEAVAEQTDIPPGRTLWVVTDSRRGRVFLEHDGIAQAHALDSLPTPDGPVCIAGEQAIAVVAALAARDVDVQLMDARGPDAQGIERAALRRLAGRPEQFQADRISLKRSGSSLESVIHASGDSAASDHALGPRAAQPLYVDPPEARLPVQGQRPPPAC